jgi:hypothetical protein
MDLQVAKRGACRCCAAVKSRLKSYKKSMFGRIIPLFGALQNDGLKSYFSLLPSRNTVQKIRFPDVRGLAD